MLPTAIVVAMTAIGCSFPFAYRLDPATNPSAAATIAMYGGTAEGYIEPGKSKPTLVVEIYDFDRRCPELQYQMRSSGYKGTTDLSSGSATIQVTGDKPVVLNAEWESARTGDKCGAAIVFRPQAQGSYRFYFGPPSTDSPLCGLSLRRLETQTDGQPRLHPVTPVAVIRPRDGFWGPETDNQLCRLAGIETDRGAAPPLAVAASSASVAEEPDTASEVAPPGIGSAPGAPEMAASSEDTAPHPTEPPIPSPQPPAAAKPFRPQAHAVQHQRADPAGSRSLRRGGTGLALRFGFSVGGETLVEGRLSDGSTRSLDAGKGTLISAGLMVTPFWSGDTVGFGFGGEIGWMGGSLSATNGDITMNRAPLIGTTHVFLRATDHALVLLGAGIRKDLDTHFSGSGFGQGITGDIDSNLGALVQAGLYYAYTDHIALDALVRATRLSYTVPGGGDIGASNIGVTMAFHVNF